MEENEVKQEAVEKPSYEELNDYCNQLMMQNRQLINKLNHVMAVQNKLPYLFEAIKMPEAFDSDFIAKCTAEIQDILYPEVENTETED